MLEVKFKSYKTKNKLKRKMKSNVLIQGFCSHYCGNMRSQHSSSHGGGAAASRDVQYHIFLTEYEYSLLSNH